MLAPLPPRGGLVPPPGGNPGSATGIYVCKYVDETAQLQLATKRLAQIRSHFCVAGFL